MIVKARIVGDITKVGRLQQGKASTENIILGESYILGILQKGSCSFSSLKLAITLQK